MRGFDVSLNHAMWDFASGFVLGAITGAAAIILDSD
jgi:hypothetical protein